MRAGSLAEGILGKGIDLTLSLRPQLWKSNVVPLASLLATQRSYSWQRV